MAGISADLSPETYFTKFFGDRHPYMTTYFLILNASISYISMLSADGSTTAEGNFRLEEQRQIAQEAQQAIRDAIPRLLGMGLNIAQVAEALGLSLEEVQRIV